MTLSHLPQRAAINVRLFISVIIGFGVASFVVFHSPVRMFFASLGATACILYTDPHAKSAAWYRVLIAHTMCAMIGVATRRFVGEDWMACTVCVTAAITCMSALDVLHPPATATSLVGFTSDLGLSFVLAPVLSGMCVLVAVSKTLLFAFDRIWPRGDA